ncbi:unnamed protein product [Cladocopium goreaui]|uniref:Fe2OG dioxygenase domain-containing protein n=1 Tax=Cladocopium goreaui TaxID=2562237 RepID=A0A9P1GQZ6_9DINO|nr:unnamed protein product [Cladocopium goreaui]
MADFPRWIDDPAVVARSSAEAGRLARFYLALQGCQLGRFKEADEHLVELGLPVRLSNDLWTDSCRGFDQPADFSVKVLDHGLPEDLVRKAREALQPDASYWDDHRYHSPDVTFYSHAHQLDCTDHIIDQLIEAMRPSLEEVAPEVSKTLTVAEWWVHQRAPDQWHGHPLHFDTNEQLLRDSLGTHVEHPAMSSVVYLCEDTPRFGATVVTSQRHRFASDSDTAALVRPRMGRQLFFDGGYLHGVMPGKPWMEESPVTQRRLTLMVGWWTSAIRTSEAADPPRPLMAGGDGTWQQQLRDAAVAHNTFRHGRAEEVVLPTTSPVWVDVGREETEVTSCVDPPYGRFFLRHRKQIDEDLFN